MVSLKSLLLGRRKEATAARPRVRLGCEQMDDRITPAWLAFTIDLQNAPDGRGAIEFNDQMVNSTGVQHLAFTDAVIQLGQPTDDFAYWDIDGTINIVDGLYQDITVEGYTSLISPTYMSVGISGTNITLTDVNWDPLYGTVTYLGITVNPPPWL